jgi:hypothetical protein
MAQTPLNAPVGLTYAHINTAATTVVKSAPGMLQSINVNGTPGANETVTIFDNTAGSGTEVAVISLATTTVAPTSILFGAAGVMLKNGLTVVTTGTTDLTVVYR